MTTDEKIAELTPGEAGTAGETAQVTPPTSAPTFSVSADEIEELMLLRTVMHTLLRKAVDARGKNISVKLDNVMAALPELHADGTVKRLNEWFTGHSAKLAEQARRAEEARRAAAAAGLAKLSPAERAALGL